MENKILLETGTNELEIVVFKVGSGTFGINVAKVESIINYQEVTGVPNATKGIKGVINHRGKVINVIDLEDVLDFKSEVPLEDRFFIVTHFNNDTYAFEVSSVVGINRLSWEDIEQPNGVLSVESDSPLVGIVKKENIILLLDFEKIVSDRDELLLNETNSITQLDIGNNKVLIAEDSPFLIDVLKEFLKDSGIENIVKFNNGKEAWEYISSQDNVDNIYCLITDIEMPYMDGLTLTKKIKDDKKYKNIPVVLFSSLISDDLRHKGESVGANAQISKPEFKDLANILGKLRG